MAEDMKPAPAAAPETPAPAPAAAPSVASAPSSHTGHSAGGPPRRRGPFVPRRKVCRFCADQVREIDWKQIAVLRSFTTERGKILSSRVTGVCTKHQRQLATAVKRARTIALLPFVYS